MSLPWRRRLSEVNNEPAPWVYHLLVRLLRLLMPLIARRHWSGQEHIPKRGGVIIVANHISNFDPLSLGEFIIWGGRWPRYLGKAEIWSVPVLGWVARQCKQIPVYRNTDQAGDSLVHAAAALEDGQAVAIFPEGTITADPDAWPMSGRRGAAQLALRTGVPVVPIAQVGAEQILGQKELNPKRLFRRLFGRRADLCTVAGPAIDLSAFRGMEPTKEVLDEVTTLILDTLADMVGELRGEAPPKGRYDMRQGRRVVKGEAPEQ